jgi:hypothetical protein
MRTFSFLTGLYLAVGNQRFARERMIMRQARHQGSRPGLVVLLVVCLQLKIFGPPPVKR